MSLGIPRSQGSTRLHLTSLTHHHTTEGQAANEEKKEASHIFSWRKPSVLLHGSGKIRSRGATLHGGRLCRRLDTRRAPVSGTLSLWVALPSFHDDIHGKGEEDIIGGRDLDSKMGDWAYPSGFLRGLPVFVFGRIDDRYPLAGRRSLLVLWFSFALGGGTHRWPASRISPCLWRSMSFERAAFFCFSSRGGQYPISLPSLARQKRALGITREIS